MTFRRLRKRTCALSSLYRPAPAREPAKHLTAARHFQRIVIQLVCEPCFLPYSSGHEHGFRTDCKIISPPCCDRVSSATLRETFLTKFKERLYWTLVQYEVKAVGPGAGSRTVC